MNMNRKPSSLIEQFGRVNQGEMSKIDQVSKQLEALSRAGLTSPSSGMVGRPLGQPQTDQTPTSLANSAPVNLTA